MHLYMASISSGNSKAFLIRSQKKYLISSVVCLVFRAAKTSDHLSFIFKMLFCSFYGKSMKKAQKSSFFDVWVSSPQIVRTEALDLKCLGLYDKDEVYEMETEVRDELTLG